MWSMCLLLQQLHSRVAQWEQHLSYGRGVEGIHFSNLVKELYRHHFIVQDGVFCSIDSMDCILNVRPRHACGTTRTISLCAVDENGKSCNH